MRSTRFLFFLEFSSEHGTQRATVTQHDQHVKEQEEEDEKESQKEGGVAGKAAPTARGVGGESPDQW